MKTLSFLEVTFATIPNIPMSKHFQQWHSIKSEIDELWHRPFFHEREIWWCSTGLNVGFEQDGKGENFSRPVLIIKGFSRNVFLCIPLTTKIKQGKYYFNITLGDNIPRQVILSQLRLLDSKRLQEKITTLGIKQFFAVKKAVNRLLN